MDKIERLLKSRLFRLAVSVAILLYLIRFVNLPLLVGSLRSISLPWLALALVIVPFSVLVRAYSFFLIVNKDARKMSIRDSYVLALIGGALNLFLPASAGDIAKVYFGYRSHGLREELLSTSVFDKLTSLIAVFALGTVAAYYLNQYGLALLALVLTAVFLVPLFLPAVVPWGVLNKLLDLVIKSRLDLPKLISSSTLSNGLKLRVLGVSAFGWIMTYSGFFLICRMLSVRVLPAYVFAVAPIITLARVFPLTLSGLGSTEATVAYLFSLVGIAPTTSIVVSLFFQLMYVIAPGLAGYFFIFARQGETTKPGLVLEDESGSPWIVRALVYRLYRAIDAAVSSVQVGTMLDVGCGQGWHLKHLREAHPDIVLAGVDIRRDALEIAKQINPGLQIEYGDIHELPYGDGSFDAVMAAEVLEHLPDPLRAIRESARVSSRYCLFTVPHEPFFRLSNMASGKYLKRFGSFPGHQQHWTKRQFRQVLENVFPEVTVRGSFPWLVALCSKRESF